MAVGYGAERIGSATSVGSEIVGGAGVGAEVREVDVVVDVGEREEVAGVVRSRHRPVCRNRGGGGGVWEDRRDLQLKLAFV